MKKEESMDIPGRGLIDPIDLSKELRAKRVELANDHLTGDKRTGMQSGVPLDVEWLKLASSSYDLSPEIKDYMMVPVVIFYANIPNRNGVGFSIKDLASFVPEYGCPSYRTWRGKPVLYEHSDHDDVKTSKGVVLDSFLRKDRGHWKVLSYLAVDREKDTELASRLMKNEVNTYSMGAYITGGFFCSICEKEVGTCHHLDNRKPRAGMRLIDLGDRLPHVAFMVGKGPVGFEISVVESPAYPMAENSDIQFW